jgi:two-component system, NarL family, response regulator NreC
VREGLKSLINAQPDMEVIGEANNGLMAVQGALELQPDVVVLDVSMPRMNGSEAAARIKKQNAKINLLALTRHKDKGFIQQLFRAGVSGYILKQSAAAELITAIRTVVSGHNYLDPTITEHVIKAYAATPLPLGDKRPGNVSEREEEILKMVAWGYSNKEIAAKLDISVKTVEAHKANATKKLELRSRIDIVRYALLQGWLKEN